MNTQILKTVGKIVLLLSIVILATHCANNSDQGISPPVGGGTPGNSGQPSGNNNNNNEDDDSNVLSFIWVQIERLGRPAINEGLVFTNAFLNAFNAIPPSADLSAAAAPVREEVVDVLNAVDLLDGVDNVDPGAIATAFLPDVLRIDTRDAFPSSAFDACASAIKGILCGGRKPTDDVMDVILTALVGSPTTDNVSYEGFR